VGLFCGRTPNTLTIQDLERIVAELKLKIVISNMGIELLPALVTYDYLKGLHNIGFTKISIGIETFNEETILKTGRKGTTFEHISDIINFAQGHGLVVAVDMMIGLPSQNDETFEQDIEKLIQIRPDQITIYPYMVIRDVQAEPSCTTKEQFIYIEKAADQLKAVGYHRKSVWIFTLPDTIGKNVYDSSKDELINDYCGFGPASFSTYGSWKVVKQEIYVWLNSIENGTSYSFIAAKTKSTDDWRKFANRIYDLKLETSHKFPMYIRFFDGLLRLAGYHKDGYLTEKGRYFSHEITKAVVESLPFPLQNPACVENYQEYLDVKKRIEENIDSIYSAEISKTTPKYVD
jgi:coproporphyrinogen III oxidase-like Fe-S oxidoreductase